MVEEQVVLDKPVYKTGDTVGNILNNNATVAASPTPAPEPSAAPQQSPSVVNQEGEVTPAVEIPATTEPNTSTFKMDGLDTTDVVEPTPHAAAQPQVKSWKEALADENERKEIIKELGLTDFALELSQHQKNGGDPADYLSAKAIDYNKVSDEALLRDELKKQNPFATPTQVDLLFKRKYGVNDEMLDEDKEFMELQQKSDAYKIRQERITEQAKFKIAAPIQINNQETEQKQIAEQERQIEEVRKWYAENEATKALMTSKRVALNLGENGTFNFNVEKPELLMKAITDGETWQKITHTKQGEPDVGKMQKIALYAFNPEQFENDLVNYGKSLALPSLLKDGQNLTPPAKVIPVQSPNTDEKDLWKNARTSTIGGRK